MNKKLILTFIAIFIIANISYAHEEGIDDENNLHIRDYDITFFPPEKLKINEKLLFSIQIIDPSGKLLQNYDVQGQILDAEVGKEISYAAVSEIEPGIYAFNWEPSFAGDYFVQYIFRSEDDEIIQPTFAIKIEDPRSTYTTIFTIIAGIIVLAIGIYYSLPKKHKHFRLKPLLVGIVLGVIIVALGQSVSYFYKSGGERGFVVCEGDAGCNLAIHWHSQLDIQLCGEEFKLPSEQGDLGKQHTHKEKNRLHYHNIIKSDESGAKLLEPEKLRLGDLFDQLNIRFNEQCFDKYCNGDKCPNGKAGELSVTVNGIKTDKFTDYSWNDGDNIELKFE